MTAVRVEHSSKTVEYGTPFHIFTPLNDEFNFDLDVCATPFNSKCSHFYTRKEDGLSKDWYKRCTAAWMNPPYGRTLTGKWVQKAYDEIMKGLPVVAMLIPARTSNKWWFEYIWDKDNNCAHPWAEVRFVEGRIKFEGAENHAPFPSVVVIFRSPYVGADEFTIAAAQGKV